MARRGTAHVTTRASRGESASADPGEGGGKPRKRTDCPKGGGGGSCEPVGRQHFVNKHEVGNSEETLWGKLGKGEPETDPALEW